MANSTAVGLTRVQEIYEYRAERMQELSREGHDVIGYMCAYAPPEIMTAAGLVPYRITGNPGSAITEAGACVETHMCPYVRNCFDQALKGSGAAFDGIVMSHSCDAVLRVSGLWEHYLHPPYFRVVNVPHNLTESSFKFFKRELQFFIESLEQFTGKRVGSGQLRDAIALHNENRALVRGLYDLRKQDPPLVTGAEMLRLLVAGGCIPAVEFNTLLKQVQDEVSSRVAKPQKKSARAMVYGCIMDSDILVRLIEECGVNLVVDDTCIGTRIYANDIKDTPDPLDGMVQCYLYDFVCPRTGRPSGTERFDYIKRYIREFNVNGVIIYAMNFCDAHKFDVPTLRHYLAEDGLPIVYIGDDYSLSNLGTVKTRIQAFAEMIDQEG